MGVQGGYEGGILFTIHCTIVHTCIVIILFISIPGLCKDFRGLCEVYREYQRSEDVVGQ